MGVPVWWERQNPRKVIQPGSSPGQCWAFKGTHGSVVVKLSNPIFVGGVSIFSYISDSASFSQVKD